MSSDADLPVRFGLSDLIAAVIIIGTVGAIFRTSDVKVQVLLMVCIAVLEALASLWGCAVLATWRVNSFFKRVAFQIFAFVSMAAFLALLPALLNAVGTIVDARSLREGIRGVMPLVVAAIPTAGMLIIELRRIQVEAARRAHADAAPLRR